MASHGDLRAGYESAKKCSKLAETSQPLEKKSRKASGGGGERVKKKHKKSHKHHGHHRDSVRHHQCHKHKHKRHRSGETKRQFALRSPHYVKSDQDSASEHSENQENLEQSPGESEQQNSSEDEREVRGEKSLFIIMKVCLLQGERLARPHHELANPPGRELWQWSGEGYKRPGGKGKSKKLFFKSIQRGRDILHVNDCAVFLSTGRSDRPYIGKIEMLWETGQASMMCKVKWFYHPEEIETCGRKFDLKLPVSFALLL